MIGTKRTDRRVRGLALLPLLLLALPQVVAAQAQGRNLYNQACGKCHGPDGSGNTVVGKAVGAKDLGSAEAKKMTDDEIRTQIEKGKNNMPPFSGTLSKAQIDSLIPIVREFSKKTGGVKKPS